MYWYLTLNLQGPSYFGLTKSILWLLMPRLLTSPGHQQPWYWLYRIFWSFSYLRKCFKYLCQINMEEWHKMQIYVYVPSENFARKGLRYNHYLVKGTKADLDNLPLYDSSSPAQLWHPDCCMSSLLPSSGGECINFKYNAVALWQDQSSPTYPQ